MTNLVFGSGPTCRGFSPNEMYFLALNPQTVTSGGSSTTGTPVRDATTLNTTSSNVDSVFSVQFNDSIADGSTGPTNLTPTVATWTGSSAAQWVSNGVAKVQVTNSVYGNCLLSYNVSRSTGQSSTKFSGYASGSLGADLSSLVDTAITGVTASTGTTQRFSNLATNTRNASLWCASVMNDTGITRELDTFSANVLIGPRHVLAAAHTNPSGTLGWVGSDGIGYVGVIVNGTTISNTDIGIYYVRDATAGEILTYNNNHPGSQVATQALSVGTGAGKITPMAMFPSTTWASSNCALPMSLAVIALPNALGIPIMHATRNNAIGTWDITQGPHAITYVGNTVFQNEIDITQSSSATRSAFSQSSVVGSTLSGDVTFTAIPASSALATNNASLGAGYPILLGTTHGAPGGNTSIAMNIPWVSAYITSITTAMQSTAQSAGDPNYASYSPIVLNLTGYATY